MKYIVYRASILFSNGNKTVINWNEPDGSNENKCNDIEAFRQDMRSKLNTNMSIIGVEVENIRLVYEEIDGRQ